MRILLAEDERSLSSALVTILKYNNFSVDARFNGLEALSFLNVNNYDLVILDIMMPKLNGLDVLKKIRSDNNKVPVLLLTAKSEIDDKVLGLDLGADDYLTKPFNTKELLARIRALTRRQNDVVDNLYHYEDLFLNRTSFELICDNNKILLTSKEFQIMELLIKNPNKVISIDSILDNVWGFNDVDMNVCWTYISYLRKKLIVLNAHVKIKAIRNTGYTLEKLDA